MEKTYLSPKNDLVFKLIFGNRENADILRGFLQNILDLPESEYDYIEFTNTHLQPDTPEEKLGILDVKLYTKNKNVIDIEIQVWPVPGLQKRILFYTSRMITEQVKRGDPYDKIQKAISIVITDYHMVKDSDNYYNKYTLYDKKNKSQFTDILEIVTLELQKHPTNSDQSGLWDWLQFIKGKTEEEWKMPAERNPQIKQAVAFVRKLSEDEIVKQQAEAREKAEWDHAWRMESATKMGLEKGMQQGLVQGLEQERNSIAKNALNMGFSIEDISKLTGLNRDEIEKLK